MKLILMRGVSGSGKSTLARELAAKHDGSVIFSTDDYFMVTGQYVFDPKRIAANHAMNQERTVYAMRAGVRCIIIDNTNTQAWEMRPYVEAATKYGYSIEIHEPEAVDIEEIMRRQSKRADSNKALPREVVEKMLARYQKNVGIEEILKSNCPF